MPTRTALPAVLSTLLAACAAAPPAREFTASALPLPVLAEASVSVPIAIPIRPPVAPLALSPAPLPEPRTLPPLLPAAPSKPRSAQLDSGFWNPMPGGIFAGYQADTGLDIAGVRLPVYALASGTLDYSEPGHTLWTGPRDNANCVRFELDTPIPWNGHHITHVYYAHLSKLETLQKEGDPQRHHIEGGELLGVSGVARGSPHLHIGLLLDGDTSQSTWATILLADQIRKVLGGYRNGQKL